jgi:hypothetical protein
MLSGRGKDEYMGVLGYTRSPGCRALPLRRPGRVTARREEEEGGQWYCGRLLAAA